MTTGKSDSSSSSDTPDEGSATQHIALHDVSSSDGANVLQNPTPASLHNRTNSSAQQRRRHRPPHMESIFESPWDTSGVIEQTSTHYNETFDHDHGEQQQQQQQQQQQHAGENTNLTYDNQDLTTLPERSSSSCNTHTRRRRNRFEEDDSWGSGAGGSLDRNLRRDERNNAVNTVGSSLGQRRNNQQRRSVRLLRSNHGDNHAPDGERDRDWDQTSDSRRITISPLSASLDAGMAALRRWIRSRRTSLSSGGVGSNSEQRSLSTSSLPEIRMGEQDIAALSHAGDEIIGRGTSSLSSNSNVLEPSNNGNSGYVYYRPYEVEVDPNNEVDTTYGSDDESGTIPLVRPHDDPIGRRNAAASIATRRRAFSEPDRARLIDFLSSVYGSRVIDGRRMNMRRRYLSNIRSNTAQQATEEQADATSPRRVFFAPAPSSMTVEDNLSLQNVSSPVSSDHEATMHQSRVLTNEQTTTPLVEMNDVPLRRNINSSPGHVLDPSSDPNRQARNRWIQINRRFQLTIKIVALLFSLLLFGILVCWVFLITCYVISLDQVCDVPLKAYFWLSTLQLVLDIFRADITKWMCRYRSDSRERVPPRVIFYNFVYLVYAIMILRLGVRCVFLSGSPSCASTAPELYFVSTVFVCLNLAAWATIFMGYLVPFCVVAFLLTWNGYFPNANNSLSPSGGIGGGRGRVGIGIMPSGIVEFPNAYSNPAPSGCIERMRVVLLDEFPASYPKECCICMMEYIPGEVIVQTPCQHIFHKRCCHEWLQLARTCPVCRTDIPEALGISEGSTFDDRVESRAADVTRSNVDNRRPLRVEVSNLVRFLRRDGRNSVAIANTVNPQVAENPSIGELNVSNVAVEASGIMSSNTDREQQV